MGSIFGWLLSAMSQVVCWEHNTRPNRRHDAITARYKATNRRAGYALAAFGLSAAVTIVWALLGPAAGDPPYQGFRYLVHRVDQIFAGLCAGTVLLAAVQTYRAWAFDPDREA